MSSTSPLPTGGPLNPYAAPETETNPPWSVQDPSLIQGSPVEALRLSRARDESNLRALGMVGYLFGTYWVWGAASYLALICLAFQGTISAPWMTEPFYAATIALVPIMAAGVIIMGYGLRRLRAWAPKAGLIFILVFTTYWFLLWGHALWLKDFLDSAGTFAFGLIVFMPMTILLRTSNASVLSAEHAAVIKQTRYIKVRSRLPSSITLAMGVVFALSVVLLMLSKVR